jgi:hypothetical protein
MMRRRVGRPGLVGTMARTAVVAGTATAVAGGVSSRRNRKNQEAAAQTQANQAATESQAQLAEMQSQMDEMKAKQAVGEPAPAAPAGDTDDLIEELTKLGDLKAAGILSEAEFAAAKARILGG